jgi:lipoyl(octanoyl) transferase
MGNRSISEADRAVTKPVWVVSFPELVSYDEGWELQRRLWTARHGGRIPDVLLLLEHRSVVTLGRNARKENLLLDEEAYAARDVAVRQVDRGGDVTWHGPGQLVGYWIFDLRALYQDVHRYLREIEEVLIRALARFGIAAGRRDGATGVWVGNEKIAAMGMHLSHWVSTHGFALNLDPDLAAFSWIVPCGLRGRGVTTMRRVLGAEVPRERVEAAVVEEMAALFGRRPFPVAPHELQELLADAEGADVAQAAETARGIRALRPAAEESRGSNKAAATTARGPAEHGGT